MLLVLQPVSSYHLRASVKRRSCKIQKNIKVAGRGMGDGTISALENYGIFIPIDSASVDDNNIEFCIYEQHCSSSIPCL